MTLDPSCPWDASKRPPELNEWIEQTLATFSDDIPDDVADRLSRLIFGGGLRHDSHDGRQ